ncbi:hypothetical protein Dimus_022401 [Dionaea muscipula]
MNRVSKNTGCDKESTELLSEMLKKAKQVGKTTERPEQQKKRVEKTRDSSNRGVDPSAAKIQKVQKKKIMKRGKKPIAPESSETESEGEILPKLPLESIKERRVIRGKIIDNKWLIDNGLNNLLELIKRQKWENVFVKRYLVYKSACREFYKNLVIRITSKKEVASSKVNGVKIEFDGMTLASILDVPGNNGICNYMKGYWEETKYCNPLETTRRFSHDDTITKAGIGENRRRDEEEIDPEESVEKEEEHNDSEETEEESDKSRESTPVVSEKEKIASKTEVETAKKSSESGEDFYDAMDEDTPAIDMGDDATRGQPQPVAKKKTGQRSKNRKVDSSTAEPDYEQKWENVFVKRYLVYKSACREFYKNLVIRITSKKEVASSKVNGVKIEFDGMTLASILDVPSNNGICNYMKGYWEETKYCNPLETTRRFSHDDTITKAGIGENRRRDEEEIDPEESVEKEEEHNDSEETEEESDKSRESTPVVSEKEKIASKTEVETAKKSSESGEDFYDAMDEDTPAIDMGDDATRGQPQPVAKKKTGQRSKNRKVDSSTAEPDYELISVLAKLDQALKANARFQELLKQYQQPPPAHPSLR